MFLTGKPNQIIWEPSKDGCYSIKQGYTALINKEVQMQSQIAFSFCWNNMILPKENSSTCALCGEDPKDVDHLFLQCSYAQLCWKFILHKLSFFSPFPNTVWDLFSAWPVLYKYYFFSCIWNLIPTIVI